MTKLQLELLGGPLDGYIVTLTEPTVLTRKGEGVLFFPWDKKLGERQARFFEAEEGWQLDLYHSEESFYHNGKKVSSNLISLGEGDVLECSRTHIKIISC